MKRVFLKVVIGNCLLGFLQNAMAEAHNARCLDTLERVSTSAPPPFSKQIESLEMKAQWFESLDNLFWAAQLREQILEINPAHTLTMYRMGQAYLNAGQFDEAFSYFLRMTRVPGIKWSDLKKALKLLEAAERSEDAAKLRRIVSKGSTNRVQQLVLEIKQLKEEERWQEELRAVDYLLEIMPKNVFALKERVLTNFRLGRISYAKSLAEEAIQVYPEDRRITSLAKLFQDGNPLQSGSLSD